MFRMLDLIVLVPARFVSVLLVENAQSGTIGLSLSGAFS